MAANNKNLFDKLELLVSNVHIDEVREIISALSKINDFKHNIEDDLCESSIYEKIALELKDEFGINDFLITQLQNNIETTLYKHGNESNFTYQVQNIVSADTNINIVLDGRNLSEFQKLTLNSYFKELVHLLYIQFVLVNLQKSSHTDYITKLKNRFSFQEEMKAIVPLALREKMKIGVLLINIDRFRAVNDEHGNEFGDRFLKLYADAITDTIRSSDIAVRFGGGEFLVLLVNVDNEIRTVEIANKLKDKLAQTYLLTKNGDKFKKTVCIGVSMFPEDSSDINDIVKDAEIALSDAKDGGRNQVLKFELNQESTIDFF
ncbi:MAG: GGDEF domain-containing protein [Campylobacterota bacterium]|nr:GGDEF domain-containing protein [Campylobacterota bacterium]